MWRKFLPYFRILRSLKKKNTCFIRKKNTAIISLVVFSSPIYLSHVSSLLRSRTNEKSERISCHGGRVCRRASMYPPPSPLFDFTPYTGCLGLARIRNGIQNEARVLASTSVWGLHVRYSMRGLSIPRYTFRTRCLFHRSAARLRADEKRGGGGVCVSEYRSTSVLERHASLFAPFASPRDFLSTENRIEAQLRGI